MIVVAGLHQTELRLCGASPYDSNRIVRGSVDTVTSITSSQRNGKRMASDDCDHGELAALGSDLRFA
jgi:hypothetical protein